jgi:hypothetical protein
MIHFIKQFWVFVLLAAFVAGILLPVCAKGQTIQLASGVIAPPAVQAGKIYVGNNTTIKGASPWRINASNVEIRNVTLDGVGVRRDGDLSNLLLENLEIRNTLVAMEINGGRGATMRNCLVERCGYVTWISDTSDLMVENNEIREMQFGDTRYGVKAFGNSSANRNRVFRRNWIHDCGPDFMAFELQAACDGWSVLDNVVDRLRFGPNKTDNDHSLVLSAPMSLAKNGRIAGNVIIAKKPRDSGDPGAWINGAPAIIEAGGDNTIIENNILIGGGVGITVTDKDGPASVTIRNNQISEVYGIWNKDSTSQTVNASNNGPNVDVGYTIEQKRAQAGRNVGSLPQGNPPPAPTTIPVNLYFLLQYNAATGEITGKPVPPPTIGGGL